jgi:hypothetical protein
MSSLVTVTRHGLSPTRPCVTRLGSALSIMTVSTWGGALNVYSSVPPFTPAPAHFMMVGHPSCPPLCCFSVSIWTIFLVPMCLSEVFLLVSNACHRFLPLSHGCSYPGSSGLVPHRSSTLVVGGLLVWLWGGYGLPRMPMHSLTGARRVSGPLYPLSRVRGLE